MFFFLFSKNLFHLFVSYFFHFVFVNYEDDGPLFFAEQGKKVCKVTALRNALACNALACVSC